MKPTQKKQSQNRRDRFLMTVIEFLDPVIAETSLLGFVREKERERMKKFLF